MISDEVAVVGVVARRTEHPALLANYAYYRQAPEGVARDEITAIVADQHDGSAVTLNVDFD